MVSSLTGHPGSVRSKCSLGHSPLARRQAWIRQRLGHHAYQGFGVRHPIGRRSAPRGKSPAVQRLIDVCHSRTVEDEPYEALPILHDREALVVATDCDETGAANGRPQEEASLQDPGSLVGGLKRMGLAEGDDALPRVLYDCVSRDDIGMRAGGDRFCDRLDSPGEERIVLVQLDQELSTSCIGRCIHRRRDPAILLAHHLDMRSKGAKGSIQIVWGAVVADHDLLRLERLFEH